MQAPALGAAALRWGLSLILLALVGREIVRQGHALALSALQPSGPWLVAAFALMLLHFALSAEGWRRWVEALGTPLSYGSAFRMLFVSNLSKYLPGGFWNFVDRGVLLIRHGASPETAGASMALELVCQLAAAALLGGLALAAVPTVPVGSLWVAAWVAVIGFMLHPRLLNAGFALADRRPTARRWPRVTVGYGRVLAMVAFYAFTWAVLSLGFAALMRGLLGPALAPWTLVGGAGSFALAWVVGTLSFLTPAGLGVREGALVLLLTPWAPETWPAVLALAARVWLMIGEVVMFAIAALIPRPTDRLP